ncbi:MAG: translation initiation factor IF-2 N-terminal domain-containing protein, partial [Desulfobacteraceae bacterium]
MARLRVYELARDLNMTNKVLLEKLDDLDISVKSHMSALDDEMIAKIKSSFFSTPEKEETIEETRIRPTVIRRRRKKVEVEASATPEAEPQEAEEAAEKADKETIAAEVKEEPIAEAETSEELKEQEPEKPQEESAAEEAEKPAAKKAKKPKKEPSAKIIKLPVKPPEKPLKEKKAEPSKAKAKVKKGPAGRKAAAEPPPEITPSVEEAKKRKRKKKHEEPDVDKKFLKKKISFKRKAVIEGEDLYAEGYRPRKQRKMAKGKKPAGGQKTQITVAKAIKRRIKIDEAIVLSELAKRMGIKASE